jgi:flagellar biosynthesis component FlhA
VPNRAVRRQRQLLLLAVAVVLFAVLPSIARWQMVALGLGLVGIGVALIVQGRRRRSPPT